MKDALGKEIILGNLYGYARQDHGDNIVIIGTAHKFTEKGLITLQITERKGSMSFYDLQPIKIDSPKVSVKPMLLFPIHSI